MSTKRLAIITARGGSKRIPKKNIREFCGKPIIAYSIEAALVSGVFDTVMVSTDDEELNSFLFSLGCYSGEPITVISRRNGICIVSIKDARYSLDNGLAKVISLIEL